MLGKKTLVLVHKEKKEGRTKLIQSREGYVSILIFWGWK